MRNLGLTLLLILLLSLLGGFAWLTHNPRSPWLEQAESWPMVGELAYRFREAYLGPAAHGRQRARTSGRTPGDETPAEASAPRRLARAPEPRTPESRPPESRPPAQAAAPRAPEQAVPEPRPAAAPEAEKPGTETSGAILILPPGRPASAPARSVQRLSDPPIEVDTWIWCLPGNRIRAEPAAEAQVEHRLSTMSYLPMLERRGDWAKVMFRGRWGWIDTAWEPPYKRRKSVRGILRHRYEPVRGSDSQRLKRAREILGIDRPSRSLGAYTLYTDVEDEDLLGFLFLAAGTAEDAYFARYGRLPSGDPERSAVLFARQADYHRYSSGSGLPSWHAGHAGGGVLAFYAEGRSRQSLARTLVHEIGHLLNDRAIARYLPPWLEEGIASDLGGVWVEGSPQDGAAGRPSPWNFLYRGSGMGLLQLAATHEAGHLKPVATLMNGDRETFYRNATYAYTYSVALVRYLLDGEDGRHGDAFRRFLKQVAIGHGADPDRLLRLLEMDAETLDQRFRAWVLTEAADARRRLATS